MEFRDRLILNIGSNFNHLSYKDIEGISDLVMHINRSYEQDYKENLEGVKIYNENGEIEHGITNRFNARLQRKEE